MTVPPLNTPMPRTAAESLIEYPCRFPIKVMGIRNDRLVSSLVEVARQFDPEFDSTTVELRESSGGRYPGVTLTITATTRGQLDAPYRAFTGHPLVKVVL